MERCKEELYNLLSSLNELNNSYNEGTRTLESCKDCGSTTGSQLALIHIMRLIENKKILSMGMSGRYATTVCVDGHKFAIFRGGIGISMVQFYEERDGKSLPAKC